MTTTDSLTDEQLLEELEKRFKQKEQSFVELNSITHQLLEVNEKLAESEAMKSHFISNITNEIINPFASIIGLAKNLLMLKENEWHKVATMATLIQNEAFSLDFQLRNIFAAAEIEAGDLSPYCTNVNVNNILQSVANSFQSKVESINLKIKIQNIENQEIVFKTDAEKFQLIVSNLLSNAIQYSHKNSQIIISISNTDNHLVVAVQDFGEGIAPKDTEVIFDRFRRLNNSINAQNNGYGLGLSVVKEYVELLKGTIEVESQENEGSIFTVIIPEINEETDEYSTDGNELFFEKEVF